MSAAAPSLAPAAPVHAEAEAARLYERHHRAVFGSCLQQLRRREDAEDAVQTTFVYALMSLRRGVVPEFELPWLLKIASNVCSSRRRADTRRGNVESPRDLDLLQDVVGVPPRSPRSLDTQRLRSALAAMPPSQRRAILLREWRGLSYNEIGSELGLSKPATETLLFRARNTLARKLHETQATYGVNGAALLANLRSLLAGGAAKSAAIAVALSVAAAPVIGREAERAFAHPRHAQAPVAPRIPHSARPAVARREARHAAARRHRHSLPAAAATGLGVTPSSASAPPEHAAPTEQTANVPSDTRPAAPAPSSAPPPPTTAPLSSSPLQSVTNDVTSALPASTPAVTLPAVPAPQLPHVDLPAVPSVQAPALPTP